MKIYHLYIVLWQGERYHTSGSYYNMVSEKVRFKKLSIQTIIKKGDKNNE